MALWTAEFCLSSKTRIVQSLFVVNIQHKAFPLFTVPASNVEGQSPMTNLHSCTRAHTHTQQTTGKMQWKNMCRCVTISQVKTINLTLIWRENNVFFWLSLIRLQWVTRQLCGSRLFKSINHPSTSQRIGLYFYPMSLCFNLSLTSCSFIESQTSQTTAKLRETLQMQIWSHVFKLQPVFIPD